MATSSEPRSYRVREFAQQTGVTVRALHYDRSGLLKPRRTRAGYRIYRESDLPRLQQILVLKFLGLPLADIADVLESPPRLDDLLKTRRYTVSRKREQLGLVLHLLDELKGPAVQENSSELASFVREIAAAVARGDSPDTPAGKALVARWRDVIARFTAGDRKLRDALEIVMKDRPAGARPAEGAYHAYLERALRTGV